MLTDVGGCTLMTRRCCCIYTSRDLPSQAFMKNLSIEGSRHKVTAFTSLGSTNQLTQDSTAKSSQFSLPRLYPQMVETALSKPYVFSLMFERNPKAKQNNVDAKHIICFTRSFQKRSMIYIFWGVASCPNLWQFEGERKSIPRAS